MILSYKHKFLFIKGRKVAGTSVEAMLSMICGPEDIITPITPIDEKRRMLAGSPGARNYGLTSRENEKYLNKIKNSDGASLAKIPLATGNFFNHMSFQEVSRKTGELPDTWMVFTVERCPYRKIISLANGEINFRHYKQNGRPMTSNIKILKKEIEKLLDTEKITLVKNIDLYKDIHGLLRTKIVRYENLEKEIREILNSIGIKNLPSLDYYKKGMASNTLDLKTIFSKSQIKKINRIFREEFELFNYPML